jgi:hypothetical protein
MRPFLALAVLLAGCATTRPFDRSTEPGAPQTQIATAGAVIITGQALSRDPGSTVLDAIRRVMPQAQITGWTEVDHCPHVQLRGRDSIAGSSDPDVYVDGTHSRDTCLLVTMQAAETGRLEVYPFGVTSRPGYPSSPHGLILIFVVRPDSS